MGAVTLQPFTPRVIDEPSRAGGREGGAEFIRAGGVYPALRTPWLLRSLLSLRKKKTTSLSSPAVKSAETDAFS